ncbi:MAG: sporulation protein Cse60 [Bacilli bacterium]|nr:sporulation protein Cse60 [Bacilli bacterium]
MRVYVLDEENELDLEMKVNDILSNFKDEDIVDIKYNVAVTYDEREQIYCFSCMIIVKDS